MFRGLDSELEEIVSTIVERLPHEIECLVQSVGLSGLVSMDLDDLVTCVVGQVVDDEEMSEIEDRSGFDRADIRSQVRFDVSLFRADIATAGHGLRDVVSDRNGISSLVVALRHFALVEALEVEDDPELEALAIGVIRGVGETFSSLESLRHFYYSVSNSHWLLSKGPAQHGTVCSMLRKAFDGISGWRN